MIFVLLLVPFLKNIIVISVTGGFNSLLEDDTPIGGEEDEEEEAQNAANDKDEKKSLKERMQVRRLNGEKERQDLL